VVRAAVGVMPCGGFFLLSPAKTAARPRHLSKWQGSNFVKESQKGCLLLQRLDDTMEA